MSVDFGRRTLVARRAGLALRWTGRTAVICAILAASTLALSVWALTLGDYTLSLGEVWAAVTGDPDAGFARTVVVEWRAPRVVAAVVFGAALGVSGAVFQSLTRNPLASPDILGFSAGSFTGAIVVIIVISGSYLQLVAGATIGGLLTALVVYLLSWRGGVQGFRLIIVGIAISAMLGSFNTWLLINAELEVALRAAVWGAGSLAGVGWREAVAGGSAILVLMAIVVVLAQGLRQLELGDDAAKATGVSVEPTRVAAVVVGVALTASVTAAAGPIAFVALAAPQIAHRLARTPGVALAPAGFLGALMVVAADLIAQYLLPEALPVGVVTVVGGGTYLIWLIVREVRRRV